MVGCQPGELLKAAEGRGPQTRHIAFGVPGNGRRGREASGGATKKVKAGKAKAGKPSGRKTTEPPANRGKAMKSAEAGR